MLRRLNDTSLRIKYGGKVLQNVLLRQYHIEVVSQTSKTRLMEILGRFLITVTVNVKLYNVTNGAYHLTETGRTSKTISVVKWIPL